MLKFELGIEQKQRNLKSTRHPGIRFLVTMVVKVKDNRDLPFQNIMHFE